MTTMRGVCEHTEGKHFTVNAIDPGAGLRRAFDGKLFEEVPPFTVLGAQIQAPDLDALHGACTFTGTVGPQQLSMVFDSATRISGHIVPALDREWALAGEGYWRAEF
ncbi:hypothetical protein NDR87_29305 [Nocardia sp. CDC159]|uniref:Uncharacterized protein n=1 Tax=Nocardia pulmonis TaxID=2951408 RepID=A0A9X2EGF9_9NOCA|nr:MULTISPECIES: hypothetical protein [Nocardia]MCM6777718.1 hypothetical protein [Nocardia pulmonis]MCM6790478.1 hypothetical protein [Nocardia sp. CDC159]